MPEYHRLLRVGGVAISDDLPADCDEEAYAAAAHWLLREALNARCCFPAFNSYHEALAVIRERYLQLEREIMWGNREQDLAVRHEAVHLGAMALRLAAETRRLFHGKDGKGQGYDA